MNSYKIFKYFAIVIAVISVYFAMRVFTAGDESIAGSSDMQASIVSPFIYLGYIVFFLTIGIVLFFVIKNLFTGNSKKTLILLGVVAVVVLVAYLFTSGQAQVLKDGETLSEAVDHWISAGFVMLYILVFVSIGAMIMDGVIKLKNR